MGGACGSAAKAPEATQPKASHPLFGALKPPPRSRWRPGVAGKITVFAAAIFYHVYDLGRLATALVDSHWKANWQFNCSS